MRIIYVRHGNPSYNPDCLTKRGHYEAQLTANYLKNKHIDLIISSTSNRAYQTGEYTAKEYNLPIKKIDWLHEEIAFKYAKDNSANPTWYFFNPVYSKAIKECKQKKTWYNHLIFKETRLREGELFIANKLDELLFSYNIKHDRKNKKYYKLGKTPKCICIFAHGGIGTFVIPSLLDQNLMTYVNKENFILKTCGIVEFSINLTSTHKIKIRKFNHIKYSEDKSSTIPLSI